MSTLNDLAFALEWFYFGDIATLLVPDESPAFAFRGLRREKECEDGAAIAAARNDLKQLISNQAYGGGKAGDPPLIACVRQAANKRRKKPAYEWTKAWRLGLLHRHDGRTRELYVIGRTLSISSEVLALHLSKEELAAVPLIDPDSVPSIPISSLLRAYDDIIYDWGADAIPCVTFASAPPDHQRAYLTVYIVRVLQREYFRFPDHLRLVFDGALRTEETRLEFWTDGSTILRLGGNDACFQRMEEYPCGAFG